MKTVAMCVALVIFFNSTLGIAQVANPLFEARNPGNEFFVGQELGRPLMTVHLIGGVKRPGVYHVPIDTNLLEVLAYAGGTDTNVDVTEISVQRSTGQDQTKLLEFDLKKVLKTSAQSQYTIQDRDTIHIPEKTTLDNSIKWITLLSSIASIALSVYLIQDVSRRNNN